MLWQARRRAPVSSGVLVLRTTLQHVEVSPHWDEMAGAEPLLVLSIFFFLCADWPTCRISTPRTRTRTEQ